RTAVWPSASTRAATSSRVTTIRIRKLTPELGRVVALDPLDPRSVLGGDEAGERRSVVMRRDRREASPADGGDDLTLRFDASARLLVVGRADEVLFARPHLQR